MLISCTYPLSSHSLSRTTTAAQLSPQTNQQPPETYVARQNGRVPNVPKQVWYTGEFASNNWAGMRSRELEDQGGAKYDGDYLRRDGVDDRKKSKYTSVLQEQHFSGEQRPITMIRYSGRSEREEAPSFPAFSRLCSGGLSFPFILFYFTIICSALASGTAPRVYFNENVSGSAVSGRT